jgi:hypothetical protein
MKKKSGKIAEMRNNHHKLWNHLIDTQILFPRISWQKRNFSEKKITEKHQRIVNFKKRPIRSFHQTQ